MKVAWAWAAPLAACVMIVLIYLWLSPDAFILALFLLPFLFIAAIVFAILIVRGRSLARLSMTAGTLICMITIPLLLFFGRPLREQVFFQIWRITHIEQAMNPKLEDRVFEHWDSWGFASMDNDTFLASDLDGTLTGAIPARHSPSLPQPQATVATRWKQSHRLPCDIVWVDRVAKGFYVLTTADGCMLSPTAA